jgi:hypothetical protein
MAPAAENAQEDPHGPWFFIEVTAVPLVRQSTEAGSPVVGRNLSFRGSG